MKLVEALMDRYRGTRGVCGWLVMRADVRWVKTIYREALVMRVHVYEGCPMRLSVKLEGSADLLKRLQSLPASVSATAQRRALLAGAEPMRAHAEVLAPRDERAGPPHLADNIVIGVQSVRKLKNAGLSAAELDVAQAGVVVEVGPSLQPSDHWYGYQQEFGNINHAAQPFMRPAFDHQAHRSLSVVLASLWESIRKALPQSFPGGRSTSGGSL